MKRVSRATTKRVSIATIGLIFLMAAAAEAQPSRWDFLGMRKINKTVDRDEIVVTAKDGTFNALKFKVKYRPVTLYDMKVHYGNGTVEDVKLRMKVPAGGESRVIDLRGGNRVIKKVVFRYETRTVRGRRAEIRLFGRH